MACCVLWLKIRNTFFEWNNELKKFHVQAGTHDWGFMSIALYHDPDSNVLSCQPIKFPLYIEGDDGTGAASVCLSDPRNGGKLGLVVKEQEDSGYSAKFKTVLNGRLEFIGAHMSEPGGTT